MIKGGETAPLFHGVSVNKTCRTTGPQKPSLLTRAREIRERLSKVFPAPQGELDWETPWQLLVATVLAQQCTDVRVNKVTPGLFARWPDACSLKTATQEELEECIRSTGFFRNKAKNLLASAALVCDRFGGQPPARMDELLTLPGVARKTANIVLGHALGVHEGIAVDTHVKRLSFRLGLTSSKDPVRIERDLMPLVPREHWGDINHLLVLHGRATCQARTPRCGACVLEEICPKCGL